MNRDDHRRRQLRRARLGAQLLAGRATHDPVAAVAHLLAIQAQDDRGFRLALRTRSTAPTADVVDTALGARQLIVTWGPRGTLHLMRPEDHWWLLPLTTPQLAAGNRRRLTEEGVSARAAARGVDVVTEALADGPTSRAQLRARLDAARVPNAGQAFVHVMVAATIAGHVARGPVLGRELAWVNVEQWLGPRPPAVDRDDALARLVRRYLQGHAPAAPEDLAKWAGITLGDARAGFAGASTALAPWGHDPTLTTLAELGDVPAPRLPRPRLLGPFDPALHGWRDRELFTGSHQDVITSNGIFRPVVLVDGRVVATWGLASGTVGIRLLEPIGEPANGALGDEVTRVLRYLGLPDREAVVTRMW